MNGQKTPAVHPSSTTKGRPALFLPVGTHVAFLPCKRGKHAEMRHAGKRNSHFESRFAKRRGCLRPVSRILPIPGRDQDGQGLLGVTIPRGHGETILVVEGDPDLRGLAAELLAALGYQALEAEDGPSAIDVLEEAASMDLLITDVVLSDAMTGRELASEARTIFPDLAVLYTSSGSDAAVQQEERLEDGAELIRKPCRTGDLSRRVRAVLGGRKP